MYLERIGDNTALLVSWKGIHNINHLSGKVDYHYKAFKNHSLFLKAVNRELVNSRKVLIGSVKSMNLMFRIHFVSKTITNDPRMVSSARRFELNGDTLRDEMEMQTAEVDQMTQHLKIELRRT